MEVRPIDANALREEFKRGVNVAKGICNVSQILHNIDIAPTLDYEPVVHAHWEELESHPCILKCSHCGYWDGKGFIETHHKIRCPKCDAKMDEEINDDSKKNKTSYAEFLLPKLKWAASAECKNLEYTQKRLKDAITCIEDLMDIIHFLPIET